MDLVILIYSCVQGYQLNNEVHNVGRIIVTGITMILVSSLQLIKKPELLAELYIGEVIWPVFTALCKA